MKLRLRGARGAILWGHRTAVEVGAWSLGKRQDGHWWLSAKPVRADPFASRQRALLFAAPRLGGFWSWPVIRLQLGPTELTAELGPPEH
jgi:hypothetical protein